MKIAACTDAGIGAYRKMTGHVPQPEAAIATMT
jgi:hypothetical protein